MGAVLGLCSAAQVIEYSIFTFHKSFLLNQRIETKPLCCFKTSGTAHRS